MARIIVLDDELLLRRSIRRALEKVGHRVFEAEHIEPALRTARDQEVDVVITDLHLGSENGLDFVRALRDRGFDGGIIIMTAYATVESAVDGMRQGADEYLQKPLSLEELLLLVERTLDHRRMRGRLSVYEQVERYARLENELTGSSRAWLETLETAERMAARAAMSETGAVTLLLTGETGTGKGSLARHIHHCIRAGSGPLVQIRCYALPASTIDNELFGRDGSAYMGSEPLRQGLFETSRGGTFFLDGIAELSLPLQSKLLAVIERAQDTPTQPSDDPKSRADSSSMLLIASASTDLAEKVQCGAFREDLFYRLNVMSLQLPPLRDREGDALLLAETFCSRYGKEVGRPDLTIAADAKAAIENHSWPGNIRELANAIQRAALMARDTAITASDLGISPGSRPTVISASGEADNGGFGKAKEKNLKVSSKNRVTFDFSSGPIHLEEMEKNLLRSALVQARGNVTQAAKLVGMTRSAMRYRIERHQLDEQIMEKQSS
ncbi:MAG: sigma-54-dependent Fis family transcriptional regulator [Planctomycetes bacterium]|nr:sigma-54-dependent Fis family transcriptional regulator [Planctomycetota bacterium]NOG53049.1 sigma-54-dependent Fis family transcriptional regulator [Planctomycetota bacterium]